MKLIVVLGFILGVCAAIYFFFYFVSQYHKRINWKIFGFAAFIGLVLLSLLGVVMYKSATAPDTYCSTFHQTSSYPPTELKTGMDYFELGNYDYDTGNCKKAVEDYNQSIKLSPNYAQAYNNRAYTNMRLGNYKDALTDLNKALTINPNYINALMNRGDIHNYYIVNRKAAIADYEKVIALGGTKGTAVCGHLFLARHDGWNLGTVLGIPLEVLQCN